MERDTNAGRGLRDGAGIVVTAAPHQAGVRVPRTDGGALGDGTPLVFPVRSGKAISASTLPKMLQYHRIAAVVHGFHSNFRDWVAEQTDHPREVIEAALAHVVQNKVEAAYARSGLFERRRRLMDDWTAYFHGLRRV